MIIFLFSGIIDIESEGNRMGEFNARKSFGFGEAGYITILYGDESILQELYNKNEDIWRTPFFGYYVPSFCKIPEIPGNIVTKQLEWEKIQDPNRENRFLPTPDFFNVMRQFNGITNNGQYQGEIGKYIERNVTVQRDTSKSAASHSYILIDDEKNVYIWDTKSVKLEIGSSIKMKMKVKDHQVYLDNNATIVWYCKIL